MKSPAHQSTMFDELASARAPVEFSPVEILPMTAPADMFGDVDKICTVEKDPDASGLEAMEDRAFTRYCERHFALIDTLDNLGLPKPGEQIRIVTRRVFNSVQFLEWVVKTETITDLKIAIYSINFHAAKILVNLISGGKIQRCEILMSNLRNKAHREKEEVVRKMFIDHPNIQIFYCSSHAKAFSCATDQGNYYTLEGSGNMSYNSRIEQYVIDNARDMYAFTCQWMAEIKEFLRDKKELEVCQ